MLKAARIAELSLEEIKNEIWCIRCW
jgi:hypothetical protein